MKISETYEPDLADVNHIRAFLNEIGASVDMAADVSLLIDGECVAIPGAAFKILRQAMELLAQGQTVTIGPGQPEDDG